VEYPVHEADARALVWVLVWQLDVDLPEAAFEGSCGWSAEVGENETFLNALSTGPLNLT
jgi:hypothetical protein